jgi:hypothetical protein
MKYAQENLVLLSDLLNKNLIRIEDTYTKYSQDLINIFKNTSMQIQNISPDQYLDNKENQTMNQLKFHKKISNQGPLKNNYLDDSASYSIDKLSNGKTYLPLKSLDLFRQGHLESLRSLLAFVLTPLRNSLSNYSNNFILLEPLYQDTLHKQSTLSSTVWESLIQSHQKKEFLEKEELIIPLLTKGNKGIGSVAFICRSKARESIEIYSPSDHENIHLKNSSFYFIR